ncbi:MAG: amidohydrolase family protein [Planctomycetota bacterium]|jgi:hypothetical protein|nr:amidohydrolase family protein [Planctomycetota bacterium]MDP6763077.1 amidohydrolase family protein [Planctomycetota bacterium]MDP6989026.1 amidohydrolase family protein [Planctomycetota bacterium]
MSTHETLFATLAVTLLGSVAPADPAQPWTADDEPEESEKAPVEIEDYYFAVTGGDVHAAGGEVLRGATLLAKNGKITHIGYDVEIPGVDYFADMPQEDRNFVTETLDATGLRVYPGLVAISSSGLMGASGDFADTADPFHQNLVLALGGGITSTGASRGVVKLKRYVEHDPPRDYDFGGIVLGESTYVSLSWSGRSPSGKASLREKLTAAADYLRVYRQWEADVKKDKELEEPRKTGVDSSILAILKGEVRARFGADDRDDLLGIARLAQEFGFRPVIKGCREGWTVADELGRAGASAIITPRSRRDKNEDLVREGGSSIENAALLHAAGIPIVIEPQSGGVNLSGIVGRDILHLPVEAAFAVRGGLSEAAALDAITIEPARMMGIGHRVGSLAVGKDCDLIVTDGDVLHYQTFVQYAVVDGELVYDKEKELFYAHIRPRAQGEVAPPEKLDAGENPEEQEDEGDGGEDPGEEGEGEDSGDDGGDEEADEEEEGDEAEGDGGA